MEEKDRLMAKDHMYPSPQFRLEWVLGNERKEKNQNYKKSKALFSIFLILNNIYKLHDMI